MTQLFMDGPLVVANINALANAFIETRLPIFD